MKTVCVLNQKGGVGKTTTVLNMAAILAKDHKQRVLVIDADSQGNATEFLGGNPEAGDLSEVLLSTENAADYAVSIIQPSNIEGVSILPASDGLMDLDLTALKGEKLNVGSLRGLKLRLVARDLFDTVLVDCPPCFNAASTAALIAADEAIVPMKLDAFSVRGMSNLLRQVANMRRVNDHLALGGVLVTMWYESADTVSAMLELRGSGLPVYDTMVRRSDKVDGMTFAQEPLVAFSPRCGAGVDYRRFVKEWMQMGGVSNG